MRSGLTRMLLAALAVLWAGCAHAQSFFPTVAGNAVPGEVQMCLNASGQAVPVSGGTCTGTGAQVATTPAGATTTITNGTITLTGTFQSVLAASATRKGCTIQNQGTHVMYAYFGANGSATTAASLQVIPGQSIGCASGVIVATDNVSLTGTTADAFVVNAQ